MKYKWEFLPSLSEEEIITKNELIGKYSCPDVIADIMIRKSLTLEKDIKNYFAPNLKNLPDPYLFKDMKKAVKRIKKAISLEEKILIFGDYDADGTTSTALFYLFLKEFGAKVEYYIPNRMVEGYGLSAYAVARIKEIEAKLVITVDCGVNAIKEIDLLNEANIDVIITDHHNPKEIIPKAYAIINPKMEDSGYPYKFLAGVGVVFKLVCAMQKEYGQYCEKNLEKYLDLVAVGTISDLVPLTRENRIFAYFGLKHLIKKESFGLNVLIDKAKLSKKVLYVSDIVFSIAPRINVAGRMGHARRAVEILTSEKEEDVIKLANIIEEENNERKKIDRETYLEACELIEEKYPSLDKVNCIVIFAEDWHQGVLGIVASKIVAKYNRPAIMLTLNNGMAEGSGRSIIGFDLFEAISSVENYLERFGGHKYAAGISLLPEYLPMFEKKINQYMKKNIKPEDLVQTLTIHSELELYKITTFFVSWLDKFSPFGPENHKQVFVSKMVKVCNYPMKVGYAHLKLKVMKDGKILDLIGFDMADYLEFIKKNSILNIAYSLEFNNWQGNSIVQGMLKDLEIVSL